MSIKIYIIKITFIVVFSLAATNFVEAESLGLAVEPGNIQAMRVSINPYAVECLQITEDTVLQADAPCLIISSNTIVDLNGFTVNGIVVGGSNLTVKNGTISGGAGFEGVGHLVDLGNNVVLDRLVIRDCPFLAAVEIFSGKITNSLFENNSVALDMYWGGSDTESRVVVSTSRFINNRIGIDNAWDNDSLIKHNVFAGNEIGVRLWDDVPMTSGNVITQNYFHKNNIGVSIKSSAGVENNIVKENMFVANEAFGVLVSLACEATTWCGGDGTLIEKNIFLRNGNDGIAVYSSPEYETGYDPAMGVTITGNIAAYNVDLGIDAVNVMDGGGNFAYGNGNPLQCVGVYCN